MVPTHTFKFGSPANHQSNGWAYLLHFIILAAFTLTLTEGLLPIQIKESQMEKHPLMEESLSLLSDLQVRLKKGKLPVSYTWDTGNVHVPIATSFTV